MKIHITSAHGDHKYTCDICGHQKSRKIDLTQHYEAMHQGKKYSVGNAVTIKLCQRVVLRNTRRQYMKV